MRLGVSTLAVHTPGGVGRYARILAATLLKYFRGELFLFLQRESDLHLILHELSPEERMSFELPARVHLVTSRYPFLRRYLLHQWELPRRFGELGLDAYLDPDYVLPPLKGTRRHLVVHDVTPFTRPALMGLKARLIYRLSAHRSLMDADGIICVSEHTRRRLAELFPSLAGKMHRLVSCLSPKFQNWAQQSYHHVRVVRVNAPQGSIAIPRPFVLFVGVEGPRKNIGVLSRAFLALKAQGFPHRLVMVGGKAERIQRFAQAAPQMAVSSGPDFASAPVLPPVLRLGHVPDEDLVALYRHADLVILISLEEGFGYPILEGLAFRTPGFVGANSPMADYGGRGVVVVERVDDAHEVASKLARALRELPEICRGLASSFQREDYSPRRYYEELIGILREGHASEAAG